MVTPELLSRYAIFSFFKPAQLRKIARIATEESFGRGAILFREKDPADAFYILLQGSVELFFSVEIEYHPELGKELKFRVIYPGESFGISAFIEPHILTASARATEPSRVVKIKALPLLDLCREDDELAYALTYQVTKAAMERLNATRLQLAAAWTPASTG